MARPDANMLQPFEWRQRAQPVDSVFTLHALAAQKCGACKEICSDMSLENRSFKLFAA
jgi:hypothetical protein